MYKHIVTVEDFEGNVEKKELYFNLTKAEITKLQLSKNEGFDKYLDKVIKSGDSKQIINLFENMILMAYGERTEDGKFIKSKAINDAFVTSEEYSALFMELLSDDKAQQKFFYGIMPKDVAAEVKKELDAKAKPKLEVVSSEE